MNLQTFRAPTMAECLGRVKIEMGHDAVIFHTRTLYRRRWLGLRRQELIEITAGKGIARTPRRAPVQSPPPAAQRNLPSAYQRSSSSQMLAPTCSSSDLMMRQTPASPRGVLETPAGTAVAIATLHKELGSIKEVISSLAGNLRRDRAPHIPQELFDYYLELTQNEVAEEIAAEVVQALQKSMRPEHLLQAEFVREKLSEQIERMLPDAAPIVRKKTYGPHIVALVGPTGVGKTTTIAKLAANLKLREKHRVGLITIDTYRIAAIDQLRRYAEIIGSPLKVVNTPEEMREAIRGMQDCDFILIDTAGRSPTDALKLNELKGLLAAAEPDEVHLVLAMTASQKCVELAIEKFFEVRVDKLIFTKIDEVAQIGTVLNVLRKVNKSLSYITTGQDVPNDIEVGSGRRLAQRIFATSKAAI